VSTRRTFSFARIVENRLTMMRPFNLTTLSGLILCVFCATPLQARSGVANKTDADLAAAVIGTWEGQSRSKQFLWRHLSFRKSFLTLNADGTCKQIGITNDRGSLRRVEVEAKWRVNDRYLIAEVIKVTPANQGIGFELRDKIESIEDGVVKLRAKTGEKSEIHRINRLPALPPLLTASKTWSPQISAEEIRQIAVSTPQPDYPSSARQRRIQGSGVFRLSLTNTGEVASIQVLKSTGSQILDAAAEKALRKWRFKPGIAKKVNVPINFLLSRHS
jgi:TonB family protein